MRRLYCKRRKESYIIDDNNHVYLIDLFNKIEKYNGLPNFLEKNMTAGQCFHARNLLKHNLEENKIFEMYHNGSRRPVICEDETNLPTGVEALSMSNLSMLSTFSNFLGGCKFGAVVNLS